MFVALTLAPASARALAAHGARPLASLHVTLAFLGRGHGSDVVETVRRVVADFARRVPVLDGAVTGLRTFHGDARDAHVATLAVPGLARLRAALVRALARAGVAVDTTHPFVAHVTLGDTAAGVAWTRPAPPRMRVRLTHVAVEGGASAPAVYPLRGAYPNAARKVRVLPGQGELFGRRTEQGTPLTTAAATAPAPAPVPRAWTGTAAEFPTGPVFGGDEGIAVPFTERLGIEFQAWLNRILDDLRNATTYAQVFAVHEEYRQFWRTFHLYFVKGLPQAMLRTRAPDDAQGRAATDHAKNVRTLASSWPTWLMEGTGLEKVGQFPAYLPEWGIEPADGYAHTLQTIKRVRVRWERELRAAFRGAWELLADVPHWQVGGVRLFNTAPANTLVLRFARPVNLRVEGLDVRTVGLDELGETEARKVVSQLARVVRHLRQTTARTMPWFFRRLPPVELDAYCPGANDGVRGQYWPSWLGGPRIALCAQAMLNNDVGVMAFVLGHELGHHLWHTSLSEDAKNEWKGFRDDWFDLPLAEIVRRWATTPTANQEEFLRRLDHDEPLVALRVRRLFRLGRPLGAASTLAELRVLAKEHRTMRVRTEPITRYGETSDEEAFCEALGLAAAYGTKIPSEAGEPWRLGPQTVAQLQTVVPQVRTLSNGPRRAPARGGRQRTRARVR